MSSGLVLGVGLSVCPGGVFVVESPVAEAAVEDADETVAECSERLVVEISLGSPLIVEPAASWTLGY